MPDFGLSGLASGFDWRSFIDQVLDLQRAPQRRLLAEQGAIESRQNAYASITTELGVLRNHVQTLSDAALFDSRAVGSSASAVATATVAGGAAAGAYTFEFAQLATTSRRNGATNAGSPLSTTSDVSGVVMSSAPLAQAVSAGTFTVNGQTVTLAASDTLAGVFTKISTATGGVVTGSYNPATDKVTLSSAGEIVLGSATDTSNFLQSFKLGNNGTGTVISASALGVVRLSSSLSAANFAAAVSDGGAGAGKFKLNGVEINFSASDTVATMLDRINASAAGVTAAYDAVNDRFTLTNKATGDLGIALQDVTGNFLAATGLAGGTLQRGQDLIYTVNGGSALTSHSNTVSEASHGIAGLTVTAHQGAETVSGTPSTIGAPMFIGQFGGAGASATRVRTAPPHNLQHGHAVRFQTTGTLPSQVNADTTYWVRRVDANNVSIHASAADANANVNAINFGASPPFTGDAYLVQVDPLTGGATTGPAPTATITVSSDTSKIRQAVTDFVDVYNRVQGLVETNTASTTDADGKVSAGVLASQREAIDLASRLRGLVNATLSGLGGTLTRLEALGITSNGEDDRLALTNGSALDAALADKLTEVQKLFAHETLGLAVQLDSFLETTIGDDGSLLSHQDTLAQQIAAIDVQITDQERLVQTERERLIASFVAMEEAQARINQQLQFLLQRFGGSSR